jgi:hypothetical protein
MKKLIIISVLLSLIVGSTKITAQDQQKEYLGLPGDNLNLYAVMDLFRQCATLEEFEKRLNEENSKINNLDLNGDNMIDYIKVIDFVDANVHNIVLQVAVNEAENQDVAVFTVQRDENGTAQIQLTGDEALYGKNYIIEPIYDEGERTGTPNPGYYGNEHKINGRTVVVNRTTSVEIAAWPIVRFIYLPTYTGWRSNWYWGYYPSYWHPWRPYYWDFYYGYHYNMFNVYYSHYRYSDYHRFNHWNDYYYVNRRAYSPHVNLRIKDGDYKSTYSHPDERREGEALFNRSRRNEAGSRINSSSRNSEIRRSDYQSAPERESRRSNVTRRSVADPSVKSISNQHSERNNVKTGRSNTENVSRPVSNPQSDQRVVKTRRSTTSVTNRAVSAPQPAQNEKVQKSSRESGNNGVKASSRRESKNSTSGNSLKKSERTGDSEKKNETRRR